MIAEEEGCVLSLKMQRCLNTLRGHTEDSLTSLTGDGLNAFSKSVATASNMEWSLDGDEKYESVVGEDYYDSMLDAYNRSVAEGISKPLWDKPNPIAKPNKKRKVSAALSVPKPLGFAPPAGKGKGGKGKGGKGRGKGRGNGKGAKGKGKGQQRGRGQGAWKSRP
jgi:hypothetical protein